MRPHPRCQKLGHFIRSSCPDCELWSLLERAKYVGSAHRTRIADGIELVRPDHERDNERQLDDHELRLRRLELHEDGGIELSGNARQLHVWKNGQQHE